MTTPFDAAFGEPCEKCPENRANYPAGRLTPAEAVRAIGELRARGAVTPEGECPECFAGIESGDGHNEGCPRREGHEESGDGVRGTPRAGTPAMEQEEAELTAPPNLASIPAALSPDLRDYERPTFREMLAAMTSDDLRVFRRLRIMGLGVFDTRYEKVVPKAEASGRPGESQPATRSAEQPEIPDSGKTDPAPASSAPVSPAALSPDLRERVAAVRGLVERYASSGRKTRPLTKSGREKRRTASATIDDALESLARDLQAAREALATSADLRRLADIYCEERDHALRQIDDAQALSRGYKERALAAESALAAQSRVVEAAKAALERYGRHDEDCPVAIGFDIAIHSANPGEPECRCGLAAAVDALKEGT